MEFNKCERCGCFFVSDTNTCGNCSSKDAMDMAKLKLYFEESSDYSSIHSISLDTGITVKNLNRFLKEKEFKSYLQDLDDGTNNGNISISL